MRGIKISKQSLRSRFFIFLLKHRHWFGLKLKRDTIDWNTSIPELRKRVEKSAEKFGKLPSDIEIEQALIDAPKSEFLNITGNDNSRLILYFHGGGYVMGSSREHRHIVAKFVKGSGINALTFDYRLAPEHPFPAALDDSVGVYEWILSQNILPKNIVFVGDSAGGGLCLATLLYLKNHKLSLPAAAVAMSPWADLCCTGESYRRKDPVAPEGSWEVYGNYYAGDHDLHEPLISPLYGDLTGLPPLYISVGENENMLDDSVQFAEKAKDSGVEVTLEVGKGMIHCYPTLSPFFPEAKKALEDICTFVSLHTDKK